MPKPISVVIPARNEAATIGRVVAALLREPVIDEVVVVNNASTDDTVWVAKAEGATVLDEMRTGMGHAFRTGCIAARNDWVMKVDADLDRFGAGLVDKLAKARAPNVGLIKGAWQDPQDNMPMTRLLVMPAIRQLFPGLSHLSAPNTGIYLLNRALIAQTELRGDYSVDLDAMVRVYTAGWEVTEINIGAIHNDPRSLNHYNAMADQIMGFFLACHDRAATEAFVAFAQTASEVIATSLGTLAARARAGGRVWIMLDQAQTPEADILRRALAPFPTAKVLDISAELPAHSAHVQIFASHPSTGSEPLARALSLQENIGIPLVRPDIFLMRPTGADQDTFDGDTRFDVSDGAQIRHDAQVAAQLSHVVSDRHERFQSYQR